LDLVVKAQEGALDVLDGVAGCHQTLDGVDAAYGLRGIDPARALMLPLAPDPARARQHAELHVLAKGGLRQPYAARLKQVDDLFGGEPIGVQALDVAQVTVVEQRLAAHAEPAAQLGIQLPRTVGVGSAQAGTALRFGPLPRPAFTRTLSPNPAR